jgi:Rieske Fe-S protein
MTESLTGRRNVLIGVAGVTALAACSSPPVPQATADSPPAASPPTVPAGETSPASPVSPAAPATTEAAGTPVAEVPVGGGRIYPDQKVVVTQPSAGTFKAFSTTCTHQACAVTTVEDGHIVCPCHGSSFAIDTGAPTAASEAKRPLEAKTVVVSGDRFTVS